MDAVLELPRLRHAVRETPSELPADLASVIAAMGKRLQAAYIEGALPYFQAHEPELWAQLAALDEEESFAAALAYERLFLAGLLRYARSLAGAAA
jgi:hypothetical protein